MTAPAEERGQVITFYSYKGGTGRSMALANAATLLARRAAGRYQVLMVDWDLEAPGLHRYFPAPSAPPDAPPHGLVTPGVIDLFGQLDERTRAMDAGFEERPGDRTGGAGHGAKSSPATPAASSEAAAAGAPAASGERRTPAEPRNPPTPDPEQLREEATERILDDLALDAFVRPTGVEGLHLMPAGQNLDGGYAGRVNGFDWEAFYHRAPWLSRMLAERLAARYRYVLIDSRTGLTDISGICTMLLPEKLVAVFTPNEQSLAGVLDLVRRATRYRRQSDDLRPLVVYPLPSRIEATEPRQHEDWRLGDSAGTVQGYQPRFEDVLAAAYNLRRCDLGRYFDDVQIQHAPAYAYGEKIAVILERSGHALSLSKSYERLLDWLIRPDPPWAAEGAADEISARRHRQAEVARQAEAVWQRLPEPQREPLRKLLLRLVDIGPSADSFVRRRLDLRDIDADTRPLVHELGAAGVLAILRVKGSDGNEIELADEGLITEWHRLHEWLEQEREFLVWRQHLESAAESWRRYGRSPGAALTRLQTQEARQWQKRRSELLEPDAVEFIEASGAALTGARYRGLGGLAVTALVAAGIVTAIVLPKFSSTRDEAYIASVKSDLRNLATVQELHYAAGAYRYGNGEALAEEFTPSPGVQVTILSATDSGWSAEASHVALEEVKCVIWNGTVATRPRTERGVVPAEPGVPACDEP